MRVLVENRIHDVDPSANQEGTGRILPSVNLKTALFAHLGTIPNFRKVACRKSKRHQGVTQYDAISAFLLKKIQGPRRHRRSRGSAGGVRAAVTGSAPQPTCSG